MISSTEILIRLTLASFFGAIIGLERERKDWTAGLRTHMIVCVGSALFMLVSSYGFSDVLKNKDVVLDPSRVAAQVVSGIGFIGAGTIMFLKQGIVRGLTTASGLWTVAAIGLASGGGMYFAAVAATVLALIILWGLKPLEKKYLGKFKHKSIKIITETREKSTDVINKVFQNPDLEIVSFLLNQLDNGFEISFKLKNYSKTQLAELIHDLETEKGIKEVIMDYS